MTYLLKHRNFRQNHRKQLSVLILTGLLFVAIFYICGRFLSPLALGLSTVASKASSAFSSNLSLAFKVFEPESILAAQNEAFKKRIAELESKVFDYEMLEYENLFLLDKLEILEDGFKTASVLLAPPSLPYDSILVDRGEKDGVFVGAKVLHGNMVLIGYTEEVYKNTSIARLLSSPGLKTNVVSERNGSFLEIEGRGGGDFFVEAPLGFPVSEGDIFVLPGVEVKAVAKASFVVYSESSSFIRIFLKAPFEVSGKSNLLVEIKRFQ